MLKAILLVLLFCILGFAAVKVVVALLLLAVMIISGVVRWVLVPILLLAVGVVIALVRGVGWTVAEVVTFPLKLIGMSLTPDPRRKVIPAPPALGVACRNVACRCNNPASARFCRRCGLAVSKSAQLPIAAQP